MRKFFQEKRWNKFYEATNVHEKWEEFLKIYKKAEEKFVPRRRKSITGDAAHNIGKEKRKRRHDYTLQIAEWNGKYR